MAEHRNQSDDEPPTTGLNGELPTSDLSGSSLFTDPDLLIPDGSRRANSGDNEPRATRNLMLRIHRRQAPITVLGPGKRAVVWVQGCSLGCRGCIIPESWGGSAGTSMPVEDLAEWILCQAVDGLTVSGGEPMEQSSALVQLIDAVRRSADLGVVCYTGFTLEALLREGCPDRFELLRRVDLLIDGPYIQRLHAPLLWRGSSNQRLLPLTERYLKFLPQFGGSRDAAAGLELFWNTDGSFSFAGVPPEAGFRKQFENLIRERGITLGASL
jgi:anaerobic ribonucleoside-triphosphate reductase activating protein